MPQYHHVINTSLSAEYSPSCCHVYTVQDFRLIEKPPGHRSEKGTWLVTEAMMNVLLWASECGFLVACYSIGIVAQFSMNQLNSESIDTLTSIEDFIWCSTPMHPVQVAE